MESAVDVVAEAKPSLTRNPGLRRAFHIAAPALLYLLLRAFGLLVLRLVTIGGIDSQLTKWDGEWYLGIAAGGYAGVPGFLSDAHGMRGPNTAIAFFPGYPALVHLLSYLGIGVIGAGLLVSLLSGIALSYGLLRLGELLPRHGSRKLGLVLVALFAAAPMSVVLSMAYPEALFCALAVWAFVYLLREQWVFAGLCAGLAGLVRPSALALVIAIGLAALIAVIRNPRDWRIWLGGLLTPAGLIGYLAWIGSRTGSVFGYSELQRSGWDTYFDWGSSVIQFIGQTLTTQRHPFEVITVGLILGSLVLLGVAIAQRVPWPMLVYSAVILVMALGMNGLMGVKARLLLPAFALLIPVAIGLAKRTRPTMLCVLLGLTISSAWFGGYALTVWPYAI